MNHEGTKGTKGPGVKGTKLSLDLVTEDVGREVVDAAIKVHRALGPGLLESAYRVCLAHELRSRGRIVETEVSLPVVYEGIRLEAGYRMDMVIDGRVVVELKAVDSLLPVHMAQVITYLKLSGLRLGFLMNFHAGLLKDGLHRFVN